MSVSANPISLRVQPSQSAYLCFEVAGILEAVNVQLGTAILGKGKRRVSGVVGFPGKAGAGGPAAPAVLFFDFPAFYQKLTPAEPESGLAPPASGYDVAGILAAVEPSMLASLRNEPAKIGLARAQASRQNAYLARYSQIAEVVDKLGLYYVEAGPGQPAIKLTQLDQLSTLSQGQAGDLATAYQQKDPTTGQDRRGVVQNTTSVLNSTVTSKGSQNSETIQASGPYDLEMTAVPKSGAPFDGKGVSPGPGGAATETLGEGTSAETATVSNQTILNTDYGYQMPYSESQARDARAQAQLYDERIAALMQQQSAANADQMLPNELFLLDNEVYRSQLGLLSTLLMSPISGTVTAIFKQVGEAVSAGEPVIRVENADTIWVCGTIQCAAVVVIGAAVTITTPLFDAAEQPLTGTVLAARGHQQDDQWEVVVQCNNIDPATSKNIFPPGYQFDFARTTLEIG